MKLGFDFDNVIADGIRLKIEAAKRLYGKAIAPEDIQGRKVINAGILTPEQYRSVQRAVYYNNDVHRHIPPVDGALLYLPKLQAEGHTIIVVTGRDNEALTYAREWLADHGLHIYTIGTGAKPKTEACRGLDLFVDDDINFLLPMRGAVKRPVLFTRPYNEHPIPEGIERVRSWKEIYDEVQRYGND
jgi:uncharacterized HAD superfamily protein